MNKAKLKRGLKLFGRSLGIEVSFVRGRGKEQLPGYIEDEFKELYTKYCDVTMVPWSGLYSVYRAVDYVSKKGIPGDIVECGVWKGGCTAFMMEMLKNRGEEERTVWLYDTFEGMTEPTEKDGHFAGAQYAPDQYKKKQERGEKWSYGPLEVAKETIAQSKYPEEKIRIVQGDVLQTLDESTPESIALLRLDTDWYESTKKEMEVLFPKLIKDGIFICDDYGSWKGSYDAVEEYSRKHDIDLFLQIDAIYGGAVGVKG